MRDKLKELILEYRKYPEKTCPRYGDETPCDGCKYDLGCECDEVSRLTDHLIANNVFVLPENMGGNWELGCAFLMRLFVADEAEIEKIKQEFELQKIKKILTDICNYLNERKYSTGKSDYAQFCETALSDLTEYAEKLGVEL